MTEPTVQYDDIILPADRPNVEYDIEEQLAAEATGKLLSGRKSRESASHSNAAAGPAAGAIATSPPHQQRQRPTSAEEPPSDTGSIHTEDGSDAGDMAANSAQAGPGDALAEEEVQPLKLKAPRKPIRNFQQHDLLGPRGVPALQQLFSATLPTLTGKRKREARDLDAIMETYKAWAVQCFARDAWTAVLDNCDKLGHKISVQASIAAAREAFIRKKLGLPEPEDELAQLVSDDEAAQPGPGALSAASPTPGAARATQSSSALDGDEDDMLALFDVDAVAAAAASQAAPPASSQPGAAPAEPAGTGPEEDDFAPPEFFDDMDFDALDAAAAAAGF